MLTPSHVLSPRYARPTSPTTGTSPSGSDYVIFCRLYLQSHQELHRLQSGVDNHTRLPRTSGLARHTDNAEAMWSGLRTFLR
ncbi:hypothetical protein ACVXHB_17860 [Escherichia coli]